MKKFIEAEPEGFTEFWTFWRPHMRHTDGKGDAKAAYRKALLRGDLPADILDGAKGFIRNMSDKDRPYIPLAASWLNKESYEAWCDKEREYRARMEQASQAQENVVQIRPVQAVLPANHFSRMYQPKQVQS